MGHSRRTVVGLLGAWAAVGCTGTVVTPRGAGISLPKDTPVATSGARRLSKDEYDNTLADLLGDTTRSGFAVLPEDAHDPFDNNYLTQLASPALIDAAETLATDAMARVLADDAKRAALVPCTPKGADDPGCLRVFIQTFGRRVLRRPLAEEEVQGYLALGTLGVEQNDFFVGVNAVGQALLQDPEFLYRVELGTPVASHPGVFRLGPYELATRLSYFLWGSTPPDWLLDLAQSGKLSTTAAVRAASQRLMLDPRAASRVERFHALWLGFHQLPHPVDLTRALRAETGALLKKVIFDDAAADYFGLFQSKATYIDDVLATHYGLPSPGVGAFAWVPYGDSGREGILSHGSVLSAGAKFSDTSPTQRGIFVRTRLLCMDIPPPPASVNVDQAPTNPTSNCKKARYSEHASSGNCAGCHQLTDPVGFGLENYDTAGRYRTHDLNEAQCPISGDGVVSGIGNFNGPKGLAELLVGSGQLEHCVVTQVYRFAMGRRETKDDAVLLDKLTSRFKGDHRQFQTLLLDVVSDEGFAFRRDDVL